MARMSKALEAFRTISEVAGDLDIPKHVLRFWESKFPQIRPMKRGGGRRYYRPEDLELLRGIRRLLHAEGYTIKGVQKILRENGIDHVKAFGHVQADAAPTRERGRKGARSVDGAKSRVTASKLELAAPASGPVALNSTEDLIRAALVELKSCRELLERAAASAAPPVAAAAASPPERPRQRAVRS